MKNQTTKRFKDDIRQTFVIYALIPIIIITFLGYFIAFYILYRTVETGNTSINRAISRKMEYVVNAYSEQAKETAATAEVDESILSNRNDIGIYEKMYAFINSMEIKGIFNVFDEDMNPVISSSNLLPEYALKENAFKWGISCRMHETPERVVIEKQVSELTGKKSLSIGKAIFREGKIIGYVTFDLEEKDLRILISENFSTNIVVTDQFGNVISGTNDLLINQFGKIDLIFRDKAGIVKSANDRYYISRTEILNNCIDIYAISSIGDLVKVSVMTGGILVGLFFILTLLTFISAKKIASSKTRVIDNIIEAIENVQNGKLDKLLNISSNDEFEVIASAYNKMLEDIKNLIDVNKEKAKQSVLSEIKQLESQFNPHFLFNTLEIIRYMVKIEPDSVGKIIVSLSNLLRYSINNSIVNVTLKEDIEYTKNYLLIQKYRYGKKFHYSINIAEDTYDCIVPKLIVQPIIENSIKYGFENRSSLTIRVKANYAEDGLVIVIYDDGVGMKPEILSEINSVLIQNKNSSSHIGLFNVHRRIQLMYGEKYGINIMSELNSGTVVKIMLPSSRGEEHAESSYR